MNTNVANTSDTAGSSLHLNEASSALLKEESLMDSVNQGSKLVSFLSSLPDGSQVSTAPQYVNSKRVDSQQRSIKSIQSLLDSSYYNFNTALLTIQCRLPILHQATEQLIQNIRVYASDVLGSNNQQNASGTHINLSKVSINSISLNGTVSTNVIGGNNNSNAASIAIGAFRPLRAPKLFDVVTPIGENTDNKNNEELQTLNSPLIRTHATQQQQVLLPCLQTVTSFHQKIDTSSTNLANVPSSSNIDNNPSGTADSTTSSNNTSNSNNQITSLRWNPSNAIWNLHSQYVLTLQLLIQTTTHVKNVNELIQGYFSDVAEYLTCVSNKVKYPWTVLRLLCSNVPLPVQPPVKSIGVAPYHAPPALTAQSRTLHTLYNSMAAVAKSCHIDTFIPSLHEQDAELSQVNKVHPFRGAYCGMDSVHVDQLERSALTENTGSSEQRKNKDTKMDDSHHHNNNMDGKWLHDTQHKNKDKSYDAYVSSVLDSVANTKEAFCNINLGTHLSSLPPKMIHINENTVAECNNAVVKSSMNNNWQTLAKQSHHNNHQDTYQTEAWLKMTKAQELTMPYQAYLSPRQPSDIYPTPEDLVTAETQKVYPGVLMDLYSGAGGIEKLGSLKNRPAKPRDYKALNITKNANTNPATTSTSSTKNNTTNDRNEMKKTRKKNNPLSSKPTPMSIQLPPLTCISGNNTRSSVSSMTDTMASNSSVQNCMLVPALNHGSVTSSSVLHSLQQLQCPHVPSEEAHNNSAPAQMSILDCIAANSVPQSDDTKLLQTIQKVMNGNAVSGQVSYHTLLDVGAYLSGWFEKESETSFYDALSIHSAAIQHQYLDRCIQRHTGVKIFDVPSYLTLPNTHGVHVQRDKKTTNTNTGTSTNTNNNTTTNNTTNNTNNANNLYNHALSQAHGICNTEYHVQTNTPETVKLLVTRHSVNNIVPSTTPATGNVPVNNPPVLPTPTFPVNNTAGVMMQTLEESAQRIALLKQLDVNSQEMTDPKKPYVNVSNLVVPYIQTAEPYLLPSVAYSKFQCDPYTYDITPCYAQHDHLDNLLRSFHPAPPEPAATKTDKPSLAAAAAALAVDTVAKKNKKRKIHKATGGGVGSLLTQDDTEKDIYGMFASEQLTVRKKQQRETPPKNDGVYCYCKGASYGDMIGCENPQCKHQWFHFSCVGQERQPRGHWYCSECTQPGGKPGKKGREEEHTKKKQKKN